LHWERHRAAAVWNGGKIASLTNSGALFNAVANG
jgi:hypothetical protein